jgi:hypothetical protein
MVRGWQSASIFILLLTTAVGPSFPAPAAGTPASGPASVSEILLVKAAGSGMLFLGGNLIEGPWTLAYDHGRLTANGFALRPAPPAPPPSAARRAESEFLNRAGALMDSLNRSALDLEARKQTLTRFLESSNFGIRVRVNAETVEIVSPDRMSMTFEMVPRVQRPDHGPPGDLPSKEDPRAHRLEQVKGWLESGCVVLETSSVSTTIVPRGRTGEFMAAAERLRSGAEPDSADLRLLTRQVRDQIRKPLPLDQVW